MKRKHLTKDRIARALGAKRAVRIEGQPSRGPLDLLGLQRVVQERLRSTGGRPTDPNWEITRSIRFRAEDWRRLEDIAERLSDSSRRVGPGQVAAILIERALADLVSRQG